MRVEITITEKDLKDMIIKHFEDMMNEIGFDPVFLKIEVKSKQNFKSEWEIADFRATYRRDL